MPKIRVFITDDHTLFRQGMKTLLSTEPDIDVVGEAANAADAASHVADLKPDVVLMDIGMPGLSAFDGVRQMKKLRPEIRVLFLTMYDDEDYLMECMEVGGSGYVLKDSPAPQLIAALREVYRGGSYLSPRMLSRLVDDFRSRVKTSQQLPRFATLTAREREVVGLTASGLDRKKIAEKLFVSEATVRNHLSSIFGKLDVPNRFELVFYAQRHSLDKLSGPGQSTTSY